MGQCSRSGYSRRRSLARAQGDTLFTQSAPYYDLIYSYKDYATEAAKLVAIIRDSLRSGGRRLLDVACGTGLHIQHLKARYECEGLDIDEGLLELARERNPTVRFHRADMADFGLDREYDIVTCLFSAIGYVKPNRQCIRSAPNGTCSTAMRH